MKPNHKEKGPRELALHMDPLENSPTQSIPQNSHYGISSFCGSVREFREYLRETRLN